MYHLLWIKEYFCGSNMFCFPPAYQHRWIGCCNMVDSSLSVLTDTSDRPMRCPWSIHQLIARRQTTIHTFILTYFRYIDSPILQMAVFGLWEEAAGPGANPHEYEENMQVLRWRGTNPSYCKSTVLAIAWPRHPLQGKKEQQLPLLSW